MPSPEYDLRYLKAGIEQLESYLLSSDVYWSIGTRAPAGETPYPQLTIGGLLLARMLKDSQVFYDILKQLKSDLMIEESWSITEKDIDGNQIII